MVIGALRTSFVPSLLRSTSCRSYLCAIGRPWMSSSLLHCVDSLPSSTTGVASPCWHHSSRGSASFVTSPSSLSSISALPSVELRSFSSPAFTPTSSLLQLARHHHWGGCAASFSCPRDEDIGGVRYARNSTQPQPEGVYYTHPYCKSLHHGLRERHDEVRAALQQRTDTLHLYTPAVSPSANSHSYSTHSEVVRRSMIHRRREAQGVSLGVDPFPKYFNSDGTRQTGRAAPTSGESVTDKPAQGQRRLHLRQRWMRSVTRRRYNRSIQIMRDYMSQRRMKFPRLSAKTHLRIRHVQSSMAEGSRKVGVSLKSMISQYGLIFVGMWMVVYTSFFFIFWAFFYFSSYNPDAILNTLKSALTVFRSPSSPPKDSDGVDDKQGGEDVSSNTSSGDATQAAASPTSSSIFLSNLSSSFSEWRPFGYSIDWRTVAPSLIMVKLLEPIRFFIVVGLTRYVGRFRQQAMTRASPYPSTKYTSRYLSRAKQGGSGGRGKGGVCRDVAPWERGKNR